MVGYLLLNMDQKFIYSEKLVKSTAESESDDIELSLIWNNFFLMQESDKQTMEAEIELLRDHLKSTTNRTVRPIHCGTSGLASSSDQTEAAHNTAASSAAGGADPGTSGLASSSDQPEVVHSANPNPNKRTYAGAVAGSTRRPQPTSTSDMGIVPALRLVE